MPVLPLVGSTSVLLPGVRMPCRSIASIIDTPIRSFTDEIGLKNSSFSRMSAFTSICWGMRLSRTSGVSPMVSVMEE